MVGSYQLFVYLVSLRASHITIIQSPYVHNLFVFTIHPIISRQSQTAMLGCFVPSPDGRKPKPTFRSSPLRRFRRKSKGTSSRISGSTHSNISTPGFADDTASLKSSDEVDVELWEKPQQDSASDTVSVQKVRSSTDTLKSNVGRNDALQVENCSSSRGKLQEPDKEVSAIPKVPLTDTKTNASLLHPGNGDATAHNTSTTTGREQEPEIGVPAIPKVPLIDTEAEASPGEGDGTANGTTIDTGREQELDTEVSAVPNVPLIDTEAEVSPIDPEDQTGDDTEEENDYSDSGEEQANSSTQNTAHRDTRIPETGAQRDVLAEKEANTSCPHLSKEQERGIFLKTVEGEKFMALMLKGIEVCDGIANQSSFLSDNLI